MQKACDFAACNHCGSPDTCRLNELGIGCRGSVFAVGGDQDVRRRLLEMGFCNGASVEVVRRAPLGDPIEFRLRGYHLSLREEQARHVQIVPQAVPQAVQLGVPEAAPRVIAKELPQTVTA